MGYPHKVVSRERLQVDERRARLLEVGRAVFADRAPDDVSVDEIAAAAGISKGLLYHYFRSKRGFYLAVLADESEELLARIDRAALAVDAEPDDARAALEAYLSFAEEHRHGFGMLMRGGAADAEIAAILDGVREAVVARVLERLPARDPNPLLAVALRGWVGLVERTTLEWLDRDAKSPPIQRHEVVELLASLLGATILAAGALLPPGIEPQQA